MGAEHLFDNIPHTAFATTELGHIASRLDALPGGIGRCYGEPHSLHTLQVGDVIAHEDNILAIEPKAGDYLFKTAQLIGNIEVEFLDTKVLEAFSQYCTPATAYDNDLIAHLYGVGYGVAIFGVVLADEVAICQRDDTSIGKDTIHIEYKR